MALDVYEPWQAFLVALAAPFTAYAVYEFIGRKLVDEHKLLPGSPRPAPSGWSWSA